MPASELNDLKSFVILLMNSVNPELSGDIRQWAKQFDKLVRKTSEVKGVYTVGEYVIHVIEDGFVIYTGDRALALDRDGDKIDIDAKDVVLKARSKPKRKISDEQAFGLLGEKLYDRLFGDEISPFDLP